MPDLPAHHRPPDSKPSARPMRDRQAALLAATSLAVVVLIAILVATGRGPVDSPALYPAGPTAADRAPLGRLDPNVAPWWELAQLPGIGEVTAKAIVAYRQGQPGAIVFRSVDDLRAVKGIGPKTAERLRGHLMFGDGS